MTDGASDASTLAKQGSITFLGKVMMRGLEFAFLALVTRMVAPSMYGVYTLALTVVLVVQPTATLNLNRAIDYFVPSYVADGKHGKAKGVLINVAVLSLAMSVVAAALVALAAPVLADALDEPGLARVLPVFSLAIPLLAMYRVSLNTFNSIKRLKYRVYTQNLLRPISKFAFVGALLLAGAGVWGLVGSYVASMVLTVAVGAVLVVTRVEWFREAAIERISYRALFSYASPLMFVGVLQGMLGRIDYMLIGYLATSADIAVYRVGSLLAGNLGVVLMSLMPIFKPMIAERRDETSAVQSNYRLTTRWVAMLVLPLAITLALAPGTYLTVLFTAEYAAADTVVLVLAAGYVFNAMFGMEGKMLEGLGHTKFTLVNTVVLIGTNAALNVLLIPRIGVVGAAVGTAVALGVAGLAGLVEIYYLEGIQPYSWDFLRVLVAGAITVAVCLPIPGLVANPVVTVAVLPVCVVVVYAVALVACRGFTEEDTRIAEQVDRVLGYDFVSPIVAVGK